MLSPGTWALITHLGNSVLLLSAALIMALWLAAGRAWRLSSFWLVTLGSAAFLVLTTKIAFLGWGIGIQTLDFTGISGHAMLSMAVIPTLAALLTFRTPAKIASTAIFLSFVVSVAVGLSRLALGAHSLSEVMTGWVVGMLVTLPAIYHLSRVTKPLPSPWPLMLAVFLLLTTTAPRDGQQGPETHGLIVNLALWASGQSEPFTRKMLHEEPGLSLQTPGLSAPH